MKIRESRLRTVIRQVIRESYEEMYGLEALRREYQNMVSVGGTYWDLEEMLDVNGINPHDVEKVFKLDKSTNEVEFHVKGRQSPSKLKQGTYSIELVPGNLLELKEGDQVRVLHVERPYSDTRQDWGGVEGIVDSIDIERGVCTIIDLSGQLSPLVDCPMTGEHLKVVSSGSSGIDNIRDYMSDTVNQDMPMESVLRRAIRKELKRR